MFVAREIIQVVALVLRKEIWQSFLRVEGFLPNVLCLTNLNVSYSAWKNQASGFRRYSGEKSTNVKHEVLLGFWGAFGTSGGKGGSDSTKSSESIFRPSNSSEVNPALNLAISNALRRGASFRSLLNFINSWTLFVDLAQATKDKIAVARQTSLTSPYDVIKHSQHT